MNSMKSFLILLSVLATGVATASIKDLAYPSSEPTAQEIAQQNQYVDKFYGLSKMPTAYQPAGRAVLLTGKIQGRMYSTFVERYINTNTSDAFFSKELSIFLSGKYKAMAFLISDFSDDRSPMFQVWRPDLRKVRRMPTPTFDDRWGGSDFTWGEMLLQRPEFEQHETVAQQIFNRCLSTMQTRDLGQWGSKLPKASCHQKERPVYLIKSTPTVSFINEYDYRVRFIDAQTYADYRTEYYKDGQLIRFVEKNWGPMGMPDPRIQGWNYMYGQDLRNNHESVFIQLDRNTSQRPQDNRFWSDATLRFLHR